MPKISIVLPVHNGESYLERAIDSIISQTFHDFELIIVNDCSTDNSLEIAQDFSRKDQRIVIVSNTVNKRLPASLNIGFAAASGPFFTWTSDDNILNPECLDRLIGYLIAKEADIVYADTEEIDEEDTNLLIRKRDRPLKCLAFENVIGACFLYRREVHERLRGFKEKLFLIEDYDFWVRSYLSNFKFYHISETLYKYRRHEKSLSIQFQERVSFARLCYLTQMMPHLEDREILKNIKTEIVKLQGRFYYDKAPVDKILESEMDGKVVCIDAAALLQYNPFNLYIHFYFITEKIQKGNYSEARALLEDILSVLPSWGEGYALYSFLFEITGNIEMSIAAIHKALSINGDDTNYKTRLLKLMKRKILMDGRNP